PLERPRLLRPRVVEDPVPNLGRQIEPSTVAPEHVDDAQRMLVVTEAAAESLRERRVERLLPRMSEGRMPEIVAAGDRLSAVLVEAEGPRDRPGDAGRLERMCQARAKVIPARLDEDLRLPAQPPERLRVNDPVSVALEGGPQRTFLALCMRAPASLVGAHRERREPPLLVLAHARLEGFRDRSRELRHDRQR